MPVTNASPDASSPNLHLRLSAMGHFIPVNWAFVLLPAKVLLVVAIRAPQPALGRK